jgi:hypothetical protein
MATITVSFDGSELILSDKGHTNASRSETIHWHPGSGVFEVTKVFIKPDSPTSTVNFWADPPKPNGKNFKGTIKGNVEGVWKYNIECNIGTKQDPVLKLVDPIIQVLS